MYTEIWTMRLIPAALYAEHKPTAPHLPSSFKQSHTCSQLVSSVVALHKILYVSNSQPGSAVQQSVRMAFRNLMTACYMCIRVHARASSTPLIPFAEKQINNHR